MQAPPEIVLAVAKQSALLEAAKPVNPSEHLVDKDILRNGVRPCLYQIFQFLPKFKELDISTSRMRPLYTYSWCPEDEQTRRT